MWMYAKFVIAGVNSNVVHGICCCRKHMCLYRFDMVYQPTWRACINQRSCVNSWVLKGYRVLWHVLLVSLFGQLYEICHTVLSILGTYVVLVCCPCPKVFTRRNDESVILATAFCEQGYWIASLLEVRTHQLSTC